MEDKNLIILRKDVFIKIFFICFVFWLIVIIFSYFLVWNMISWENNFFLQSEEKIIKIER